MENQLDVVEEKFLKSISKEVCHKHLKGEKDVEVFYNDTKRIYDMMLDLDICNGFDYRKKFIYFSAYLDFLCGEEKIDEQDKFWFMIVSKYVDLYIVENFKE